MGAGHKILGFAMQPVPHFPATAAGPPKFSSLHLVFHVPREKSWPRGWDIYGHGVITKTSQVYNAPARCLLETGLQNGCRPGRARSTMPSFALERSFSNQGAKYRLDSRWILIKE
jgi:hypothetical protein